MTNSRPSRPSSRVLAVVVAVANLAVCGAVVAVLTLTRDTTTPTTSTSEATGGAPLSRAVAPEGTTTTESHADGATVEDGPGDGFQQVIGPGGMTTHIPADWPTHTTDKPGAMQAEEPTGTSMMLRYGGSPTTLVDSYDSHVDYERTFSSNRANFVPLRLERTLLRGMPAVDWEFEYDAPAGRRHVRSVYWLADGHEYFVYASAPVALWPDAQLILGTMLTHSTP